MDNLNCYSREIRLAINFYLYFIFAIRTFFLYLSSYILYNQLYFSLLFVEFVSIKDDYYLSEDVVYIIIYGHRGRHSLRPFWFGPPPPVEIYLITDFCNISQQSIHIQNLK